MEKLVKLTYPNIVNDDDSEFFEMVPQDIFDESVRLRGEIKAALDDFMKAESQNLERFLKGKENE